MNEQVEEKLEVIRKAGYIAFRNGAELSMIEEIIRRMSTGFELENVESLVFPNGFAITCIEDGKPIRITLKKVEGKTSNLAMLDSINLLSMDVEKGKLCLKEAADEMDRMEKENSSMSPVLYAMGAAISAAGITMMIGGSILDDIIVGVMAFITWITLPLLEKIGIRGGGITLALSFVQSLLIVFGSNLFGKGYKEVIIVGALMLLVPGLTMTTGVLEIVQGDTLSGINKGLEAVLTAIFIFVGAFMAMGIGELVFR